jgi:hypothetical protein
MAKQTLSRLLLTLALGFGLTLASCGGPDYCKCLDEAKNEIPDPKAMQQCREQFADLDEAAVKAEVEKCAAK